MGLLEKTIKFFDRFSKVLASFSCTILAIMTALVVINVFLRYFLGVTFPWAEELVTVLFITSIFLGAVLGVKEDDHIKIDIFIQKFTKYKYLLVVCVMLIIIFVQYNLIIGSIPWIDRVGRGLTLGLRMPKIYLYSIIPISSVLIIAVSLTKIIEAFISRDSIISEESCQVQEEPPCDQVMDFESIINDSDIETETQDH